MTSFGIPSIANCLLHFRSRRPDILPPKPELGAGHKITKCQEHYYYYYEFVRITNESQAVDVYTYEKIILEPTFYYVTRQDALTSKKLLSFEFRLYTYKYFIRF